MKQAVCLCLLALLASCGHDGIIAPTAQTSKSVPAAEHVIGPSLTWYSLDGAVGTNAPLQGCFLRAAYGDALIWLLTMRDAGEAPFVRFRTYSFHDDVPGCDETSANLRTERVRLYSGTEVYGPHESGQTLFAWPANEFACGRSKVVIDLDAAGQEANLVHVMLDYGVPCDDVSP